MKRLLVSLSLGIMITIGVATISPLQTMAAPVSSQNDSTSQGIVVGWNGDKYSNDGISYVKGLYKIEDRIYYFEPQTNQLVKDKVITLDKKLYYVSKEGYLLEAGLYDIEGTLYLVQEDKSLATGWQNYEGSRYYFNPVYGFGLKGGIAQIQGVNYLFKEDGKILLGKGFVVDGDNTYYIGEKGIVTGKVKIGKESYFFNGQGILAKETFIKEKYATYYAKADGSLGAGFTKVGEDLYYFNPVHHFMLAGGIVEIHGKNYLFTDNGSILKGDGVVPYQNHLYYVNKDQSLGKELIKAGEDSYWANPKSFRLVKNDIQGINQKLYYFGADAKKVTKAGLFIANNSLYLVQADTSLATGWKTYEGKTYYFNPVYGFGLKDGIADIQGKKYLFREDGSILTGKGFIKEGEDTYYIGEKGVVTGITLIDGKKYLFKSDGKLASQGFIYDKYATYYIHEDGRLASGWTKIEGKDYYFNPTHHFMLADGVASFGGKGYLFTKDGYVSLERGLVQFGNKTYYIKEDGSLSSGLIQVEEDKYFFNPTNYEAVKSGTSLVGGKLYYFDGEGKQVRDKSGLQEINNTLYLFNKDSSLATGWQYYNGNKYYFNPVYGFGLRDGRVSIGGADYLFTKSGSVYRGWLTINGDKYYYHPVAGYLYKNVAIAVDGKLRLFNHIGINIVAKGLHKVDGHTYFIGDNEEVYENRNFTYEGRDYAVRGTHVYRIVPERGWDVINGHWSLYDGNGEVTQTTWVGGNYVIVSIAQQMMWVYNNGVEVVATPVVTGQVGRHDTPRGHWKVWEKSSPTHLIPNSRYWLAFQSLNGIHDASWQPYFGGNRYTYRGSHGCVNTPVHIMPVVYNNVFVGTPVIVY